MRILKIFRGEGGRLILAGGIFARLHYYNGVILKSRSQKKYPQPMTYFWPNEPYMSRILDRGRQ
jgi:hypothetical protein